MGIKLEAYRRSDYSIDNSFLQVVFPFEENKDSKDLTKNLTNYPTCKFIYRIYRHPFIPILTSFVPMFSLAWILLTVMDYTNDLNSRTANIVVVLLAYISFLTSLRQMIPPSSQFSLSNYVLCSNLLGSIIVLF